MLTLCARSGRIKIGVMTTEDVLRTEVPWASFEAAGIITRDQLEHIYALDKQSPAVQVKQFKEKGTVLVTLFCDVLSGINKDDVIAYTLAMLDAITDADGSIASYFVKSMVETNGVADPMKPLLKLLTRSSPFIVEKAATVLAKLIGVQPPMGASDAVVAALDLHLVTLSEWVVVALKEVNAAPTVDIALAAHDQCGAMASS